MEEAGWDWVEGEEGDEREDGISGCKRAMEGLDLHLHLDLN